MSGVVLRYKGVGIGANESFDVNSVSDMTEFSKKADVIREELAYQNVGNPCDMFSVALDGSVSALSLSQNEEAVGIWSNTQSDEKGMFSTPIQMTMMSSEQFTTAGITITFDEAKGIYATHLLVKWYRDNTLLSEKEFFPNEASFFCSNKVDAYNRVDIVFYALNVPKNRLRLQSIDFGIITEFTARNLKAATIKQGVHPISNTLDINTLTFTVMSRDGIDFVFQENQPVEAVFDDNLKGRFFVKTATKKGRDTYNVTCEDYIGILDDASFIGDIYKNKNVASLILEICNTAKVPVIIPAECNGMTVSGYLPRASCRRSLQQVLFAIQMYADTSNAKALMIKKDAGEKKNISEERIMQGLSVKESKKVSSVEVTAHSYAPSDEDIILYDAEQSGSGENITVFFSEPCHSFSIANGKILEANANYAIINADYNAMLKGKKYLHTMTTKAKANPLLTIADKTNVLKIETATLVNSSNIDSILTRCYNYLVKNKMIMAKVAERKHDIDYGVQNDESIELLDEVTLETSEFGDLAGRIERQTYALNGGILVKECVIK